MLEREGQEGQSFKVFPGVLRIMKLQSRQEPMYLLLGFKNRGAATSSDLLLAVERGINTPPSLSTTKYNLTALEQEGLILRQTRGLFELTVLGRDSVTAFGTFHQRVFNPLVDFWKERTTQRLGNAGSELVEELSRLQRSAESSPVDITSDEFHITPGVLHIMHALSDATRLNILFSLVGDEAVPFRKLQRTMEQSIMAGSTLSNLNTELARIGLVTRDIQGRTASIQLTSLGKVTLDAFSDYHSQLGKSILEDWKRHLSKDFGISLPI